MTGISFFEVMRGELLDRWGRRHPVDFEIKAEARAMGRFARSGRARITGIVDVAPWATRAPLQGELSISLLRRRTIEYRFAFCDEDGVDYELHGRKALRLRRPVDSFTRMTATLRQGEHEVAHGQLQFDINQVLAFFGSWWPSSSIRAPQAPTRLPASTMLGEHERHLMVALVEATIVPGRNVPAPDAQTFDDAIAQLADSPRTVQQAFRAGLRWLDATALLRTGRRFAALPVAARGTLLGSLSAGPTVARLGRYRSAMPTPLLVQMLTASIRAAHFGRRDYLRAIGHPTPLSISAETPPRYFQRVIEPESLDAVTEVHAEVAVVGTGAGGAAVAAALAEKGVAVAILEEGRYRRRHDFTGTPAQRMASLWRYAGMNFALGSPVLLPVGRMVGGTTAINSGTCFTTPDQVLQQWRTELGFPSDFAPSSYHGYSDRVAHALRVEPGETKALGRIAQVVARGADRLGLGHGPLPRNAPGCPGAGECILGCPQGAKRSTDVSYIPDALKAGAELYVGLPVTRILKKGRRVVAIEARGTDDHGAPKVVRVFAERFVLACGSLQTPVMLFDNDLAGPRVGKNLSVHPAMGLVARMPEPLEPWAAIPQGYAVHDLEDQGIRFEGYYLPPQMLGSTLPYVGEELTRWMDDFAHLGQFGFMVRDGGDGWVRRGRDGRPLIGYRLSDRSRQRLALGASRVAEIFIAAGATEVDPGIARQPIIRTAGQARALAHARPNRMDFRLLGAHPLGSCAMGSSPDTAVVDFEYRRFGTDNLHIVDGSVVPTSLGVNPQMTIMAFALRAADVIADLIERAQAA